MAYEQRENGGTLFRNKDKDEANPKTELYPHAKGRCKIAGVEYWINSWTKKDRNGEKYQSLTFKLVDKDGSDQRRQAVPKKNPKQHDDDIPDEQIPF